MQQTLIHRKLHGIEATQQLFSCQWFLPGWRGWARLSWFPAPGGGTGTRLEGQEIVTVLRALIAPPQAKPKDSPRPVLGPISKLSHAPLLGLGTGNKWIFLYSLATISTWPHRPPRPVAHDPHPQMEWQVGHPGRQDRARRDGRGRPAPRGEGRDRPRIERNSTIRPTSCCSTTRPRNSAG